MAAPVLHPELIAQGWEVAGQDEDGEWYFENDAKDLTAYEEDLPAPGLLKPDNAVAAGAAAAAAAAAAVTSVPATPLGALPSIGSPGPSALPSLASMGATPAGIGALAAAASGAPGGAAAALGGAAAALPAIGGTPLQQKLLAAAEQEGLSMSTPGEAETPKLAGVVKAVKERKSGGDPRPVCGQLKMASGTKDQKYVYIPDALVLGEKRDKLTAAKLLSMIDLPMPQLIFYVTSGDRVETWEFRQPSGYNLESVSNGPGDKEEKEEMKLAHWRTVLRQKLNRVLSNTAKSCVESGAP